MNPCVLAAARAYRFAPKKILSIEEKSGKCGVTDGSRCDQLRGCERVCPVNAMKIFSLRGLR